MAATPSAVPVASHKQAIQHTSRECLSVTACFSLACLLTYADGCLAAQAFAVTLRHNEKLAEGSEVYLQFALLYSSTDGQRLVR